MKLTIKYLPESRKCALVSIDGTAKESKGIKANGGDDITGWVPLTDGFDKEVGDTVETDFTAFDTRKSKADNGAEFTWLLLS